MIFIFVVLNFFGCAIRLVSSIATKAAWLPESHSPHFSRRKSGRIVLKQMFSVNSVLQIGMIMVLC